MKNKTSKPTKSRPLNKHGVGGSAAKLLTQLSKAQTKLDGLQGDMAQLIHSVSDIEELTVFWQAGDGFVVCDSDANNAPLRDCLAVIRDKGKLTREDYDDLRI